MKRIWLIVFVTGVLVAAVTACSNSGTGENQKNNNAAKQEASSSAPSPSSEPSYTLSGEVTEENGVYFVTVDTDFKLTSENYGGSPVEGEGHVHFYLNGSLIGPITSEEPFEIEFAKDGMNTIMLELANHNHSTFGVTHELTFEK